MLLSLLNTLGSPIESIYKLESYSNLNERFFIGVKYSTPPKKAAFSPANSFLKLIVPPSGS